MKLIETIKGIRQFYVYDDMEVIAFNNKVHVGNKEFDSSERDDFYVDHGVLTKHNFDDPKNTYFVYVGDHFEEFHSKYKYANHFSKSEYYSSENGEGGIEKCCMFEHGQEYCFTIREQEKTYIAHYDSKSSILMIPLWDDKTMVFYTKTGERLWEYKEEDKNLKINGRCIPVVDDVVVVISEDCAVAEKIQGFNIHTGKKLWEISNAEEIVCPNTFFVGEDQYLYGCCTECAYYDEESNLIMTKLNPKNGNTESIDVGMGFSAMSYDVTMHGRQLYYIDNRPGNEIGVIDVDKKELIERVPLNIKKKVTIGAPVVTDDKVYVFIRDLKELRVFEK